MADAMYQIAVVLCLRERVSMRCLVFAPVPAGLRPFARAGAPQGANSRSSADRTEHVL